MTALYQKHGPEYKKYTIQEDGVYYEIKSHEGFTGRLIKFESIGFEEILLKHKPSSYATGLFVSVMFNILFLLLFIINFAAKMNINSNVLSGLAFGIILPFGFWGKSIFKYQKEKFIKGAETLGFYYFKNKEQEVDQFIQELKTMQQAYMRNKYMQIDELIPAENQKGIFYWLYDAKFISRAELQDLLDKLDKKVVIKGF